MNILQDVTRIQAEQSSEPGGKRVKVEETKNALNVACLVLLAAFERMATVQFQCHANLRFMPCSR
jgi:hypothetical protein